MTEQQSSVYWISFVRPIAVLQARKCLICHNMDYTTLLLLQNPARQHLDRCSTTVGEYYPYSAQALTDPRKRRILEQSVLPPSLVLNRVAVASMLLDEFLKERQDNWRLKTRLLIVSSRLGPILTRSTNRQFSLVCPNNISWYSNLDFNDTVVTISSSWEQRSKDLRLASIRAANRSAAKPLQSRWHDR